MVESVLAIIGGGRWGQVILSVLANMNVPFDRIVIVSKANTKEVSDKIAAINVVSNIPFENLLTISDLLTKYRIKAAIVVNSATQHFETALYLIRQGVHVLIEKPIVSSVKQMQILIDEAIKYNVVLVPGLNYLFCSYIKNFALLANNKSIPKKFYFRWIDVLNEERYGQVKKHDLTISVVEDVMPHVWSILYSIFRQPRIKIQTCMQDNLSATLALLINQMKGEIILQRNGTKRERCITLEYDHELLTLDFAVEPGTIFNAHQTFSGDLNWDNNPSPLTYQFEYFFSTIIKEKKSTKRDLELCLDTVSFTEHCRFC